MNLTATVRDTKKNPETLRKEGFVPGELYGHKEQNMHICVPEKDFSRTYKEAGESTVISLSVSGKKYPVLVHDVQMDYMSGRPRHVDFYMVQANEKISVSVPFDFEGEAPAVKAAGGVLTKAMQEIEVEALPADLPHDIKVSLSALATIGDAIRVKDIKAPKGVVFVSDIESVIVSVGEPAAQEEVAAATEVVVETQQKKEERDAAKASAK